MYRTLRRLLCALCIPAAILCTVQVAAGEAARAFAGSYKLSNVVENGDQVAITLTLTLQNPGSSDVRGGIVIIRDTQPHSTFLGSFGTIKSLPHQGHVTVSKTLSIPASEYARWQQGLNPVLQFLVPDASGTSVEGIQARRLLKPSEAVN